MIQISRGQLRLRTAWLVLAALAVAACGTTNQGRSLPAMLGDQRMAVVKDCISTPERFGFPYTREEYMRWRRDVGHWMPDLHQYCISAARKLVK